MASEQTIDRAGERWARQAPGLAASLVLHAVLLAILAVVTWRVLDTPEPDLVITLGESSAMVSAGDGGDTETSAGGGGGAASATPVEAAPPLPTPTEPIAPPDPTALGATMPDTSAFAAVDPALELVELPQSDAPDGGPPGVGLLEGTSGEFQRLARGLGRRGLDVVLVIDATDSMSPYIDQAKARLHDVIGVLTGVLRDAGGGRDRGLVRFGVVAFKDYTDDFGLDATTHLPLTNDVDEARAWLDRVFAGGGGDIPEPIHRALGVATDADMNWQRSRAAMILLVGDAPVHSTGRREALGVAREFATRRGGTIHVIDVGGAGEQATRRGSILPDFQQIAQEGRGSAFLLGDADRFWARLITSVFGPEYARDIDLILEKYATQPSP